MEVKVEDPELPSSLPVVHPLRDLRPPKKANVPILLSRIRENIIGDSHSFTSPYGERKITYADYVASGRLLKFFEDFMIQEVYPFYANTHTTASVTGKCTTLLREEARNIILSTCGGSKKEDVLIFCGSGATEAINSLVKMLDIERIMEEREVIVFVAVYEHHSNILPWREMGCKVVLIPEDEENGGLDFTVLEQELVRAVDGMDEENPSMLIGSFSAASNITGMKTDVLQATRILHKYGAYAFFDFACSAPYTKIDMNQTIDVATGEVIKMDAIFFSTHKFLGGPGGPGVLIAKKKLIRGSDVVVRPGGGTVFWVTEHDHVFLKSDIMKQEGGTPNIIGTIRAGMCCYLKERIGEDFIEKREEEIDERINRIARTIPNLVVVGNRKAKKLPVLSFLIKTPLGMYLHSNYVSALLNDLFGLQTRAGCMCAGPYGESLLGLNYKVSKEIESILLRNEEAFGFLRPGFTRLNFHYVMTDELIDFVMECIRFVSEHGWKLLIEYNYHPKSGSWRHFQEKHLTNRRWIHDIYFDDGEFEFKGPFKDTKIDMASLPPPTKKKSGKSGQDEGMAQGGQVWSGLFQQYLDFANDYVKKFKKDYQVLHQMQKSLLNEDVNKYRWFIFPFESYQYLRGTTLSNFPEKCIVVPKIYHQESQVTQKDEEVEGEEEEDDDDDFENPLLQIELYDDDDDDDEIDKETRKKREERQKKKKEKQQSLWKSVPSHLLSPTMEAIERFQMIKEGDNVLLGVSGGKDSLTLLHVLKAVQSKAKIKFGLGVCTIDPCADGYNPEVLKPYMKSLGIEYFYVKHNVIELAKEVNKSSICSFCSRMRRGLLYSTCRKNNYNVLILAQHLDDLVESFMMSIFHNGLMRTMKAHYVVDEGDIRVARPLVFVRESKLREYAKEHKLPIIFENCPACFEIPKERKRIKKLLKVQESRFPHLFKSFKSALIPLMQKGEIFDEEKIAKKFKTRKMKEEERRSAITGLTKGVAKQRKILGTAPTEMLMAEVERRNRKKKNDGKLKIQKEEITIEKKERSSNVMILMGFIIAFCLGMFIAYSF